MKEFLEFLYKQSFINKGDVSDQLFTIISNLSRKNKFSDMNLLLESIDLNKLDTSALYIATFLTANYINQLSYYKTFYQSVREEFARRGEEKSKIDKLFSNLENGGNNIYDPNAPVHKSPDTKFSDLLDEKINFSKDIGDKDLERILNYYKADMIRGKEKRITFDKLRSEAGDEVLRKRTIKSLREMADILEKGTNSWPGIYYCYLPKEPILKNMIDSIEVVVSYPWGG